MIKARLDCVKDNFMEELHPKYIMKYLVVDNVVTEEESEDILSLVSSKKQVEKLFDILSTKSSKEYEHFLKVLKEEDEYGVNYPWLAKMLIEADFTPKRINLKDEVHKLLIDGGVPFQITYLLPREHKTNEIRKMLISASNSGHVGTSWVVLHGMSGTGKSILAAEALRNNDLINKYFYEGVFWISLGCLPDVNALENKMKRLYQNISESKISLETVNKPSLIVENVNDINQNLRKLIATKKILVVLDDLWESQDFKVGSLFDIGCPILVTTKFRGIVDSPFKLECANDLHVKEAKDLFAMCVNCKTDELPSEVDHIAGKLKGIVCFECTVQISNV